MIWFIAMRRLRDNELVSEDLSIHARYVDLDIQS
jgi:hypothetical protein